jgi:hypothetical protein
LDHHLHAQVLRILQNDGIRLAIGRKDPGSNPDTAEVTPTFRVQVCDRRAACGLVEGYGAPCSRDDVGFDVGRDSPDAAVDADVDPIRFRLRATAATVLIGWRDAWTPTT